MEIAIYIYIYNNGSPRKIKYKTEKQTSLFDSF